MKSVWILPVFGESKVYLHNQSQKRHKVCWFLDNAFTQKKKKKKKSMKCKWIFIDTIYTALSADSNVCKIFKTTK